VTTPGPVPVALRHPDKFFIGGQWVKPSSASVFNVTDSDSEELFLTVPEAQAADMDLAIGAAWKAFDEGPWPRLSHAERAEYIRAIGAGMRARSLDFGNLSPRQSGMLFSMASGMPYMLADAFDYYAGLADTFAFEEPMQASYGGFGLLVREPVGVVGAIIPWNGPLSLMTYKIAPALIAGCTVIIKASPESPGEAYVMAEIAEAAGLPPGVINLVTADREVSELLVTDPRVNKITFTGSTVAGKRIASLCGARIARCTLELGGKSAAVILDDADIPSAAGLLGSMECILTGQVCSSLTRIVVAGDRRHDEMVEALAATFAGVKVGNPFAPDSQMGPLASSRALDRVTGYVAAGSAGGAKLAFGGGRPTGLDRGWYVEPTLFGDVDNHSAIAKEEIFGPVLSVIRARDEDDAVRIANDTPYGLNASVFTADVDHARVVAGRLQSGTVGHNTLSSDFGIGFGGFKQSGIGREGGIEGLLPFLESKTVVLSEAPSKYR
jgi:aldehyde dehydrogenase (NAD+)